MGFKKTTPVLALVLGLAGSASAVDPAGTVYFFEGDHVIPWGSGLTSPGASFDRQDHGDLNGDGLPDVVVLEGGRVVYICGPGIYEAMHDSTSPTGVSELAIARRAGTAETDILFTCGSTGLLRQSISPTTGLFAASQVVSAGWADVTILRAREDATGVISLCGAAAGGVTVRTMRYSPSSGVLSESSFTVDQPVVDLAQLRDPTLSDFKLAVLQADGVSFHDPAAPVPPLALPIRALYPFGSLCTFPRADDPTRDAAAWVTLNPAGSHYMLLLLDETGVLFGTLLMKLPHHHGGSPSAIDINGLYAGDVNQDGFSDLLVSAVGTGSDYVLWNSATAGSPAASFSVAPGRYNYIDLAPGALETTSGVEDAAAMLVDLDADGGLEYVRPCTMTDGLYAHSLVPLPAGLVGVPLPPLQADMSYTGPAYTLGDTSVQGQLRLTVTLPDPLPFPVSAATHIQAILWVQEEALSQGSAIDGDSVSNEVYALAYEESPVALAPLQVISVPIPQYGGGSFEGDYYFVELRLVDIVTTSYPYVVVDRSSPSSTAFTVGNEVSDPTWDDYFAQLIPVLPLIGVNIESLVENPLTAIVGAILPLHRLPIFTEDDPPKAGPIAAPIKQATVPEPPPSGE